MSSAAIFVWRFKGRVAVKTGNDRDFLWTCTRLLKVHRYTSTLYLFVETIELLFLMKYIRAIQVRTSTVKTREVFGQIIWTNSANWDQPAP